VSAGRESKCDLRLETRPAIDVLVASAGVDTGALLHLGKKKAKGGGGGNQLDKGEKERKGVFFENASSPRAPLPSAPTTADARQTQKRPQRGDCSILQKNKPGGCFGEEGGLLLIFSQKKGQSRGSQIFN
jgi:hypothetical protein